MVLPYDGVYRPGPGPSKRGRSGWLNAPGGGAHAFVLCGFGFVSTAAYGELARMGAEEEPRIAAESEDFAIAGCRLDEAASDESGPERSAQAQ